MNITIDRSRIDHLRAISAGKKTQLEAVQDMINTDVEKVGGFRRDILKLNRRSHEDDLADVIKRKEAEAERVRQRIEIATQTMEIGQERLHAANRLLQRCEDYLKAAEVSH